MDKETVKTMVKAAIKDQVNTKNRDNSDIEEIRAAKDHRKEEVEKSTE